MSLPPNRSIGDSGHVSDHNAIVAELAQTVRTVNNVGPDSAGNVVVSGGGDPITSADITDSTSVGRSVLTAADAATARSAIGAGTSNLAIGTTGSTAAAGNRAASTTAIGMVELATNTEATTGTDTTRAVTPAGVKAVVDALSIPDPTGATAGHVWTADGNDGADWEPPTGGGGGGLTLLAAASLVGGSSVTIDEIPGDYYALQMYVTTQSTTPGGRTMALTVNGDTEANYSSNGNNEGQSSIPLLAAQNGHSGGVFHLPRYATDDTQKVVTGHVTGSTNAGNSNVANSITGGRWHDADPITSLTFTLPSSSVTGEVRLYGIGEAP